MKKVALLQYWMHSLSLTVIALWAFTMTLSGQYTYQLNDGFEGGYLNSSTWWVQMNKTASATVLALPSPVRAGMYACHLVNNYSDTDGVPVRNVALGKTVTVSTQEGQIYSGSYAVDGNLSTRWSSAFSDPQWITVDLGGNYSISEVDLNWETACGANYSIQTSTDNINWTIQNTVTGNTISGPIAYPYSNAHPIARYVRMYGTARATQWGYSLYEFSVYGTATTNIRTDMSVGDAANSGALNWGDEYWVGLSFYLKDWSTSAYGEVVYQFHSVPYQRQWATNIGGRCLMDVYICGGVMNFQTITFPMPGQAPGSGSANTVWQAPVQPNAWYDWVIHVLPSTSSTGIMEVWLGGDLIYSQKGANVDILDSTGSNSEPLHYLICGSYNWPWSWGEHDSVTTREIIVDEVKIGHVQGGYTGGYAGVAPGGNVALSSTASAPINLMATLTSSGTVNLTWFNRSNNASNTIIQRKTGDGGVYSTIATLAATVTSYSDPTGPLANTTYYYRVYASNSSTNSPYSLEANVRREDFSTGNAADFSVIQGTWTRSGNTYQGAGPANAGATFSALTLLNTPVSGDFVLTADCSMNNTSSSWDNFVIVFGYQDANNYYYVHCCEGGNGSNNGVYKVQDGVKSILIYWPLPYPFKQPVPPGPDATFSAGITYTMKVQRIENSLLVYENGVLIASVLDTTFTNGKVGFGDRAPQDGHSVTFSNVTLTQANLTGVQEDFSVGAGDFTVAQGTWTTSGGLYQVTGNGTYTFSAALSLLTSAIASDYFTISAEGQINSTPSGWDNMNIVFNYQDINNYYYVNACEDYNGTWDGLYKVKGGTKSALVTWTTTFTPGVTYALKVQKVGNVISVYSNNTLIGTATDSDFISGQIGFGTSQPTTGLKTAIFDNIVVTYP